MGSSAKSAPEPLLRFCARLKRLQEASGLPQKALARKLHLSDQQMSGILTGKIRRLPPWERVQAIVDLCYQAADTRSLPPDLADHQAWRGRYTDLERDLEAAAGTPGLAGSERPAGSVPSNGFLPTSDGHGPRVGDVTVINNSLYLTQRQESALVSVTPPWALLPEHLRGRDAVSDDLKDLLDDPPSQMVVLHGAGGYGKSALALWLARRAADRHARVWWISAHDAQILAESLRAVAIQAGADPVAVEMAWAGRDSAPDLLWRTLDALDDRWVLVVDNADDIKALSGAGRVATGTGWLRPPRSGHGLVVVTSRQGNPLGWPRGSDLRRLTGLEIPDAGRVLLDLAGSDAGSEQDAERLGERLGGLPLALRLAGNYLAASSDALLLPGAAVPRTFADYLAALDERLDLLDAPPGDHEEERDERELITRTWELSLDLLARRGHTLARPLLRLLSCFGPAPIPLAMLDPTLLATVPTWATTTPDRLRQILRVLLDLGLVDRINQTLTVHRLIRETNRHHAEAEPDLGQHVAALATLVDAATAGLSYNSDNWPSWHALASHVEAALELCRAHLDQLPPEAAERTISAGQRAVTFRRAIQDLDQAAADYGAIIDIQRETLGEHDRATLATRMDLTLVHRDQGLQNEAERELLKLLDLQRRTLGHQDPDTLRSRHTLAGLFGNRGDWSRAEQVYRETMETALRELGPEHEATLACRDGLARSLHFQHRLAEAETAYRESLEAHREALGDEHHHTMTTWHGYATMLAERNDSTAAVREFRAILRITKRKWGEKSEPTLSARHGLAVALRRLGRNAEARDHYQAIIDIGLSTFGPTHPGILYSRYNLALVLVDLGDLNSAKAELSEVLTIQRQVHGDTHPDTLNTRFQLATVHLLEGDVTTGRQELRDFLNVARPALSQSDPLVRQAEEVLSRPALPSSPRLPPPMSRHERRQLLRARKKDWGG
ncbi:tetratricopeptide repeat protein [Amycolatopsis sp. NPDC051128]|uniref:tetratricopeptide repeat protein n=1 Tax=Amycolatopsis sp. NPDC051128 TaxID=3155412 RepID=UPI00343058D9